jgi:hypothetical protein
LKTKKNIHLVFGGKPVIYEIELMAFDLALQELGYTTTIISLGQKYNNNYQPPGDFNIVLDPYNRMKVDKRKYNVLFHQENNERIDYDDWNKVLHRSVIKLCDKSIYFPLGYSSAFDYRYDISKYNEDIDISFFGKISETREKLIKNIEGKYNITIGTNLWNEDKDIFIARSKINLTIRAAPNNTFETLRSIQILSKGKVLFAEENYVGGYGYMEPYLIPFNVNTFNDLVDKYIENKIRKEFCDNIKSELVTKHSFTKYVKELILN